MYRRRTVGIVFQAFNLLASLTALENVMVPLDAAGVNRKESRERAEELLERVGLKDRMRHRPGDLSGGQQQRVAVARAIALDPPLILADEPTAHLDFIQVEEVLRLIRELASGERLVVVATHDTRMLPLADRVWSWCRTSLRQTGRPRPSGSTPGSVLFEQGSMGDLIYIVSEGELDIVRELSSGGEELLRVATLGDYFGGDRNAVRTAPLGHRSGPHRRQGDRLHRKAFRERLGPPACATPSRDARSRPSTSANRSCVLIAIELLRAGYAAD